MIAFLAALAPAAARHTATSPSFIDFATRSDEWIAIAGSEPLGWALFSTGIAFGFVWWFSRNGVPRRARSWRSSSKEVASSIAKSARIAIENMHRPTPNTFSANELADLRVFYEKWLNLAPEVRDALGESLRSSGIDMIKLGEAIRAFKETPKR
jgi:hypothetical protein